MASEIEFPIGVVYRKVGPGAVLAEALFYPELTRLAPNRSMAAQSVRRNIAGLLAKLPPAELMRRRRAQTCRSLEFDLVLPPPRENEAWQSAVVLKFHAAIWEHPPTVGQSHPASVVARIAELGIEVIAEPTEDLVALLRREALAALRRFNLTVALRPLAACQTAAAFQIGWEELKVPIPTLKEREARAEAEAAEGKQTLLSQIATLLQPTKLAPAYEVEELVQQVVESLTARPPQSVLLIGPSGVGKTALAREVARRKSDFQLGSTPFYLTSGARIVAGQTGFGMWEQRCQELLKEVVKKQAILHVGPLIELLEVGKSECNQTGIAAYLRPAIARGELLCIAECTPEQLPLIEKQDPQLLDAFRHVTLEEPDPAKGRKILTAAAAALSRRELPGVALAAIDQLHRRYATYSAYPGRPLRFLEARLRDGVRGVPVTEAEVYAAFTRETGLPPSLVDPGVPLDLAESHSWFSSRVVGQAEGVQLVVDLLATIKAGLARPNRPIASLLFIGPTGVGKTEMAKALAEFLFGSRDRLTRFDMSEYSDPVSVRRLVGGAFGSEGLLTAKIREQPFCVLLLDEVEKADPSFFDLLLQALGEARLTDAGGRLADFRNTVVILTSNLGAESFRKGSTGFTGNTPTKAESRDHFTRAVEQFLRPEMFNRLDRVVPFSPLGSETIRRITDREWAKVLQRDGVRFRGVKVSTDTALLDHLSEIGFDPRYGARPLKRAMERELLGPLARQMNRHGGDIPLTVEVGVTAQRPTVVVRPIPGAKPRSTREPNDPVGKFAAASQLMRRWHQAVETSSVVRELQNEVYQLTLLEKRVFQKQRKGLSLTRQDHEGLAKLGRLREIVEEVNRQRVAAFALEDDSLIAFHDGLEAIPQELVDRRNEINSDWDKLLLRLYSLNSASSDSVTLALFAEETVSLGELAHAYKTVAERSQLLVEACWYVLPGSPGDLATPEPLPAPELLKRAQQQTPPKTRIKRPRRVADDADPDTAELRLPVTAWMNSRLYLTTETPMKPILRRVGVPPHLPIDELPVGTIGIGLVIAGRGAHVRFCGETGLHEFIKPNLAEGSNPNVLVHVATDPLSRYRPPEGMVRRGAIKADQSRRRYDSVEGTVEDFELEHTWNAMWGELSPKLEPVILANMRARLIRLILE